MHTSLHYVVMEITVVTKTIRIFDGLHWDLLKWKDHVIRAMRNCQLVDPFVAPYSAQFIPDPVVSETVGCSRKLQEYVNRFDITIAMQKWRLERGSFLHHLDGSNCGPIACLKILELFHAIDTCARHPKNAQTWDTEFPHRSHHYLLTICARRHTSTLGTFM